MESGSLTEFALEPDASALHFYQTLAYIQAQAVPGASRAF